MADLTVPFALDENGKLISASSETSDFKNLTCIECSKPLIHRKSYYRQCRQQKVFVRSHFAHHGGTGHGTGESYYHKSAKRILCENDVIIYNSCLVCKKELSPYHRVQAEKCTEEFGWEFHNQQFRIDVAEIDKGQPKAFIEVKNTNACTPTKIKSFKDSKIPWFEIDAKELCEIFKSPSFFLKIKPIKSSLPHICELCFKKRVEEEQRKKEANERKRVLMENQQRFRMEKEMNEFKERMELEEIENRYRIERQKIEIKTRLEQEENEKRLRMELSNQIRRREEKWLMIQKNKEKNGMLRRKLIIHSGSVRDANIALIILLVIALAVRSKVHKQSRKVLALKDLKFIRECTKKTYFCVECFQNCVSTRHFVEHKERHLGMRNFYSIEQLEIRAEMILKAEKTYYGAEILHVGQFYSNIDKCFWLKCLELRYN